MAQQRRSGLRLMGISSASTSFIQKQNARIHFRTRATSKLSDSLQRRHIKIDLVKFIGKESNSLENVGEGQVHSEQNVYTEYVDPKRDEWTIKIRPALKQVPLGKLVKDVSGGCRDAN